MWNYGSGLDRFFDETERTLEESVEFAHQWIMDRIK